MKKYSKCSRCGREDIFEENDTKKICRICKSFLLNLMVSDCRHGHVSLYEQFLSQDDTNPYKSISCRCRLPGGRLCDAIDGHAKEISVIGCLKCNIRITNNTLSDVMKEDDDAIE